MKILLLNQCFYPDVVSTAQHASDLAASLAERGNEVTVIASRRAYNDPNIVFEREEHWNGCNILRVPCLGLGKQAKWRRVLNFGSFFVSCALKLLLIGRFDMVIGLTTPPLISSLAALFAKLNGGRFIFWIMDLNPDEAIAAGWLNDKSAAAGLLKYLLNASLRAAAGVVVLDRFMRERVIAKGIAAEKVWIIPVWSHNEVVHFDREGRAAFRRQHGLTDKFVVMYSGNHTPCHPLDTVLEAALKARDHQDIAFCFVGGGSEYSKVVDFANRHQLTNIKSLPYQPLARLSASLSAADIHLVVMGEPFVGIVHTCKIYNIMRIGSPVIYVGPSQSHVGDIAAAYPKAPVFQVRHGDAEQVLNAVLEGASYSVPNEQMRRAGGNFLQGPMVLKFAELIEALYGVTPAIERSAEVTVGAEPETHSLAASI